MNTLPKLSVQITFGLFVWAVLMCFAGYRFGTGDHPEYLSYTLYLSDHSLYPHDFFLQSLIEKVPNERTILAYFLLPFVNHLEVVCFLLQAFFTVLLVVGLQRLGFQLVGNIIVVWLSILLNFTLFFDKGLGNVELYNDSFQTSNASVAVISFALLYFLRRNFLLCSVLMSIASVLHPVEGLVVFMVVSISAFLVLILDNFSGWKTFILGNLFYLLTAGVFVSFLLLGKLSESDTSVNGKELFQMYHNFRLAHHYVFNSFPVSRKVLFVLIAFLNLILAKKFNHSYFLFSMVSLTILVVYAILTDIYQMPTVANLQFYKITQWLKFTAILLAGRALWKYIPSIKERLMPGKVCVVLLPLTVFLLVVLCFKPQLFDRPGIVHQLCTGWKEKDDMVRIAMEIKNKVRKDAVFIQPFDNSDLKFFGEVSSYVDWKAFVKDKSKIKEWYRRIQLVYAVSMYDKEKGFELNRKANEYISHLNLKTVNQLKQEGVTHILIANKKFEFGKKLFENKTYAVYML